MSEPTPSSSGVAASSEAGAEAGSSDAGVRPGVENILLAGSCSEDAQRSADAPQLERELMGDADMADTKGEADAADAAATRQAAQLRASVADGSESNEQLTVSSSDDDGASSDSDSRGTARVPYMSHIRQRLRRRGAGGLTRLRKAPQFPMHAFETVGEGLLRYPWMVYPSHLHRCVESAALFARRRRSTVLRARQRGELLPQAPPQSGESASSVAGALRRLCVEYVPESFSKCLDDNALKNWNAGIQDNIMEACVALGELTVARLALRKARTGLLSLDDGMELEAPAASDNNTPLSVPDEDEELLCLLGELARAFQPDSLFNTFHKHDSHFPTAPLDAGRQAVDRSLEIIRSVSAADGSHENEFGVGPGIYARPVPQRGPGGLMRWRNRSPFGVGFDDSGDDGSGGGAASSEGKVGRPQAEHVVAAHIVEVFSRCGGIHLLVEALEGYERVPSVAEIAAIVHVLASAVDVWTDEAARLFHEPCLRLLERIHAAFSEGGASGADAGSSAVDGSLSVVSLMDEDGTFCKLSLALEHLERIIALGEGTDEAAALVVRARCGVVEALLGSSTPSFHKQLTAVRELSKLLVRISDISLETDDAVGSARAKEADVHHTLRWLQDRGILEVILRSNFHHKQYVDQVANVMLFLVRMDALRDEHLENIWAVIEAPEQHDSVKTTTLGLLITLAWHLSDAQLNALFARLQSILVGGDTRTAQRTVDAIEQMVTQDTKATMARRVTELMWGALLGTPTNAGVADDDVAALLIDALASGAQRYDNAISATELAGAEAATHRAQLIDRAIGAIAEPRVAGRALKLLSALLNVYPAASKSGSFGELPTIGPAPPPSPSAGTSRSTKLAELEGRLGLTELVVKLACKAASAGSELLVTLLDFLHFVLESAGGKILLSRDCAVELWGVLLGDGGTGRLAEVGLNFLSMLLRGEPLLDAPALHALMRALEGLPSSVLSPSALHSILACFVWSNVQGTRKLVMRPAEPVISAGGFIKAKTETNEYMSAAAILVGVNAGTTCGIPVARGAAPAARTDDSMAGLPAYQRLVAGDLELDGIEVVWRAALQAPQQELVAYCTGLLCHLYVSAARSAAARGGAHFGDVSACFIAACTDELRVGSKGDGAAPAMRAQRSMQMLRVFLDMCELERWEARPTSHATSFRAPTVLVEFETADLQKSKLKVPSNCRLLDFRRCIHQLFQIDAESQVAVLSCGGRCLAGDGLPIYALGVCEGIVIDVATEPANADEPADALPSSAHPGEIVAADTDVYDLLYLLHNDESAAVRACAHALLGRLPTDPRVAQVVAGLKTSTPADASAALHSCLLKSEAPMLYSLEVLDGALADEQEMQPQESALLDALAACGAPEQLMGVLDTVAAGGDQEDAALVSASAYYAAKILGIVMDRQAAAARARVSDVTAACDAGAALLSAEGVERLDAMDVSATLCFLRASRRIAATKAASSVDSAPQRSACGADACGGAGDVFEGSFAMAYLHNGCFMSAMQRARWRGQLQTVLARLLREDGVGELLTELLLSPSDSRLQLASSLQRVLCSGGQAAAAKAKPESPPVSEAQTAADPPATAALASEVLQLMRLLAPRRELAAEARASCRHFFLLLSWACQHLPAAVAGAEGGAEADEARRLLGKMAEQECEWLLDPPAEQFEGDDYVSGRLRFACKLSEQLIHRGCLPRNLALRMVALVVSRWLFPEGVLLSPHAVSAFAEDSCGRMPLSMPSGRLSNVAREIAYRLLKVLMLHSQAALRAGLQCLRCVHYHGGGDIVGFDRIAASSTRAPGARVGLQNAGATCYMNSVIQQLFMQPRIRSGIMAVSEPPPQGQQESVLYQLQSVMGALQGTAADYHQPSGFWHAFKDYDGTPIDLREHQDAVEFFNRLVDQVDEEARGRYGAAMSAVPVSQPHPQVPRQAPAGTAHAPPARAFVPPVSSVLGGSFAQQVVGRTCPHRSERVEPFSAITLEVQGLENLHDSLAAYVRGELLEGDNAYLCEECCGKVSALKRVCVRHAPHTLLLHLRRFDFDYETMQRLKLRGRFAFPVDLDLEPYTAEGVARADAGEQKAGGGQGADVDVDTSDRGKGEDGSEYKYALAGVVIHSGTAFAGHYYSIAKDRESGQWLVFDDTRVAPYDIANLEADCFGGKPEVEGGGSIEMDCFDRPNSAYMLVYEKTAAPTSGEDSGASGQQAPAPAAASGSMAVEPARSPAAAATVAPAALAAPAPTPAPTPVKPSDPAHGALTAADAAVAAATAVLASGGNGDFVADDDLLIAHLLELARPSQDEASAAAAMPASVHRAVVDANLRLLHERQILSENYFNLVRDVLWQTVVSWGQYQQQKQQLRLAGAAPDAAKDREAVQAIVLAADVAADFTFGVQLRAGIALRTQVFMQQWRQILVQVQHCHLASAKTFANRVAAKSQALRLFLVKCNQHELRGLASEYVGDAFTQCTTYLNQLTMAANAAAAAAGVPAGGGGAEGGAAASSVGHHVGLRQMMWVAIKTLWDAVAALRGEFGTPKTYLLQLFDLLANTLETNGLLAQEALDSDLLLRCVNLLNESMRRGFASPRLRTEALNALWRLIRVLVEACVTTRDPSGQGPSAGYRLSPVDAVALGVMAPTTAAPLNGASFVESWGSAIAYNLDLKRAVVGLCKDNLTASYLVLQGMLHDLPATGLASVQNRIKAIELLLCAPALAADSCAHERMAFALTGYANADRMTPNSVLGLLLCIGGGEGDAAAGSPQSEYMDDDDELDADSKHDLAALLRDLSLSSTIAADIMGGPLREYFLEALEANLGSEEEDDRGVVPRSPSPL